MYKISELKELIKLLDQSSIHSIEIENENGKLVIKKPEQAEQVFVSAPPAALPHTAIMPQVIAAPQMHAAIGTTPSVPDVAPATVADDETSNLHQIVSPMVGTFYRKPAPDKPDYVAVGESVSSDKVVCIVEAMKLMNEIKADVNGEIVKILVTDGEIVEFGQPLFLVKTDA